MRISSLIRHSSFVVRIFRRTSADSAHSRKGIESNQIFGRIQIDRRVGEFDGLDVFGMSLNDRPAAGSVGQRFEF